MVAHSFYNTSIAQAYGEERIPTLKLYTRFWLSVDDFVCYIQNAVFGSAREVVCILFWIELNANNMLLEDSCACSAR